MLSIFDLTFTVLDVNIPMWVILIVFLLIASLSLMIYLLIFFNNNKKYVFKNQEVNNEEFKRLEKFEDLRNDFEKELGQIKKIQRTKK